MSLHDSLSGIVLAGGESRRMGRDKRLLTVDGEPLLRRVVERLRSVADDVVLVESERSQLPLDVVEGIDLRVVADRRSDAGPLAGIEAGLLAARAAIAVVVAADLPWLEPALLRLLAAELAASDQHDAVVIRSQRGLEPLLGAYRSSSAKVAGALLDRGERRLGALLDVLRVRGVEASAWRVVDPDGRSLRNVNRPSDLDLAAELG